MGGHDIDVDHLHGDDPLDIHSAAHYLQNPNVHLPLLARYVNAYSPTDADIAQGDAFERHCRKVLTAKLRQELDKMANGKLGEYGRLLALIQSFRQNEGAA